MVSIDQEGEASEAPSPSSLVLALRDTSRVLQMFLTAQARAHGLGLPELITLARSADDEGVTPYAAGRTLGMRSSTMTSLSDRLEREGLLRRVAHPTDRRLILLTATRRGHELLESVRGSLYVSLAELTTAATPSEREFLGRFLGELRMLLTQQATVPPTKRRPAKSTPSPPRPRKPLSSTPTPEETTPIA